MARWNSRSAVTASHIPQNEANATEACASEEFSSSSTAFFAAAVPFAKVQLPGYDAFIPIYQSALVVNDLITAVLLFRTVTFWLPVLAGWLSLHYLQRKDVI